MMIRRACHATVAAIDKRYKDLTSLPTELSRYPRPYTSSHRMAHALPLTFQFTCIAAPVQAEGTVARRAFYFRARGEE